MKFLPLMAAILILAGCGTIDSILSPNPNVVATLEASLAAADNIALPYVLLPKCGAVTTAAKVCSDAAIVKNIGKYENAAYAAIKAARANETASTVNAATNALSAYQAVVNSLQ